MFAICWRKTAMKVLAITYCFLDKYIDITKALYALRMENYITFKKIFI